MNHSEAIKCILKRADLTQDDIAERIGSSRTTITMRINRNVTLLRILELLDAMGYEMAAMPKNCPPLPEDAYALRKEDYQ